MAARKIWTFSLCWWCLIVASVECFCPQSKPLTPHRSARDHPSSAVSTRLHATVPLEAYWAVGHVVGGCTGTPIVVKAINSWYRRIALPPWTPPDRVFAPVWTTLYACMGVAACRIYKLMGLNSPAMKLWFVHYLLNLMWAPAFFGLKRLRWGHFINMGLLGTLLGVFSLISRQDPVSVCLLVPYFLWVVFAAMLNFAICKLNPTNKGYNNSMLESDIYDLQQIAKEKAGLS